MTMVMVVDDNDANLKLATLVLTKAGYSVCTATDGQNALEVAREQRPALIVMDVQMPGMSGLDATRALRADPAIAGIKVIALTAQAMKGDEQRILAAGCNAYLAKPFHYKDLLAVVQRLLA